MNKLLSALLGTLLAAFTLTASAATITYDVRGIDNAVFGNYQTGFNAQSTAINSSSPAVFDNIFAATDSYSHLAIDFYVGGDSAGANLLFQIAADGGFGGAVYIDGVLASTSPFDIWWGYNWNNTSQLLIASLSSVTVGTHALDFYWAEGCCNGGQSARFNVDGGNWQQLSAANLAAVPEPGARPARSGAHQSLPDPPQASLK